MTVRVDSEKILSSTLAYDHEADQWTEKVSMPTTSEHLASAVVDNKL